MRKLMLSISLIFALSYCASNARAYTLTFDDIQVGQDLSYYQQQYWIGFAPGWEVTEHSGSNVLVWNGNPVFGTAFGFGVDGVPGTQYSARSVGAYFSTEPGVVVHMIGYTRYGGTEVASVTIGAPGASWDSRYAEISSVEGNIDFVHIIGDASQDERYHFSLDNMTIVPVPEPSAILALLGGIAALEGLALKRRRN